MRDVEPERDTDPVMILDLGEEVGETVGEEVGQRVEWDDES